MVAGSEPEPVPNTMAPAPGLASSAWPFRSGSRGKIFKFSWARFARPAFHPAPAPFIILRQAHGRTLPLPWLRIPATSDLSAASYPTL